MSIFNFYLELIEPNLKTDHTQRRAIKLNYGFIFSVTGAILGIILIFFFIPYWVTKHEGYWVYNDKTGVIGDTIGGTVGPVVALVGVILTFFAFFIQYRANNIQKQALFHDQFESKFFELLRMNKENLREIDTTHFSGKKAIRELSSELMDAYKIIKHQCLKSKVETKEMVMIAAYYFSHEFSRKTHEELKDIYVGKEIGYHIDSIHSEFAGWRRDSISIPGDRFTDLELYLRHLLHISHYLIQNETLMKDEKQFYLETLKAQISRDEAIVIYFYSHCDKGNNWVSPTDYIKQLGIESDSLKRELDQ